MRIIFILFALSINFLWSGIAKGEESFGRLFTTPAERANLDYLRRTTQLPKVVANQPTEATAAPAVASPVSVQGYVKRSDGKKSTVWVNNAPVQEGSGSGEVTVGKLRRDDNQVPIKLSTTGKSLSLKAGQVYDPETDSVLEVSAYAKKMAKDEAEDSGTIGENPIEPPDSKQLPDTDR
jgi:hypothetical protein